MTDTTPEAVAGMVERLQKVEGTRPDSIGICTQWHRNPDGPGAAAMLTALSAEVEKQSDEVARLRIELADAAFERDKLRPERDQARADLTKAVEFIRGMAKGHYAGEEIRAFVAKHTA